MSEENFPQVSGESGKSASNSDNPYQGLSNSGVTVDAYGNSIPEGAVSSASMLNYLSILFGIVPSFFYWLGNRNNSSYAFVAVNAASTFNFALLVALIKGVLIFIPMIGWVCLVGVWVFEVVQYLKAASSVKRGEIASFPIKLSVLN